MLNRIRVLIQHILRFYKTQSIVLVFYVFILIGAILLTLPISAKNGIGTSFIDALFTATSATCVTGLVVVDTYNYWSFFGQVVILLLIQIGGLGIMTMATMFSLFLRRTISLNERLLIKETLNSENINGMVKLTRQILFGTFFIETIGALILSIRFIPEFGFSQGIFNAIFHSISAFCNAGFDLMGQKAPFSSLTSYVSDPLVNITIMLLIITGGIGFAVWSDVISFKKPSKLLLHTKIVLTTTGFLILVGAILFYLFEYNNPHTMANLSNADKVLASIFQSITPRTAGYNTIDQATMTDSSKLITMLLMFIGGAPGSTAGGIKVVTFAVLIFAVMSVAKGKSQVVLFKRKISASAVMRSMAISMIALTVILCGTVILSLQQTNDFIDVVFEVISAFGTVGLSAGVTLTLTSFSKITLIIIMFFGRVGVLTATIAFVTAMNTGSPDKIGYPEEKIIVG